MNDPLVEFRLRFIEDAGRLINDLERDLMLLDKNPQDKNLIEAVFRGMHTIKGTSGMYGFTTIEQLTHQLETLFDLVRDEILIADKKLVDVSLSATDVIRYLLNHNDTLSKNNLERQEKIQSYIKETISANNIKAPMELRTKGPVVQVPGFATWQITFIPEQSIITQNINLVNTFRDLFALGKYHIARKNSLDGKSVFIIFL